MISIARQVDLTALINISPRSPKIQYSSYSLLVDEIRLSLQAQAMSVRAHIAVHDINAKLNITAVDLICTWNYAWNTCRCDLLPPLSKVMNCFAEIQHELQLQLSVVYIQAFGNGLGVHIYPPAALRKGKWFHNVVSNVPDVRYQVPVARPIITLVAQILLSHR